MGMSLINKNKTPWRQLHWLTNRCDHCRRFGAETYHQNTRFIKKEDNIVTLCPSCKEANDEYWAERWSEIYY
jgi:hypothetical protein